MRIEMNRFRRVDFRNCEPARLEGSLILLKCFEMSSMWTEVEVKLASWGERKRPTHRRESEMNSKSHAQQLKPPCESQVGADLDSQTKPQGGQNQLKIQFR